MRDTRDYKLHLGPHFLQTGHNFLITIETIPATCGGDNSGKRARLGRVDIRSGRNQAGPNLAWFFRDENIMARPGPKFGWTKPKKMEGGPVQATPSRGQIGSSQFWPCFFFFFLLINLRPSPDLIPDGPG